MTVPGREEEESEKSTLFSALIHSFSLYQHTQRANDTLLQQGCVYGGGKEWKKLECCIKSTIATYAIDWRVWYKWNSKAVGEEWNWILNSQTSAHENEWDKWANGVYAMNGGLKLKWDLQKSIEILNFEYYSIFLQNILHSSQHMHSIGIEFEVWNIAKYIIFGVRGVVDAESTVVNAREGLK